MDKYQVQKFKTDEVKIWAKYLFRDVELNGKGFAISCITVLIESESMTIVDFELSGKSKESNYLWPSTYGELLKKMIFHCGEEKINERLKNDISTYSTPADQVK